MMRYLVQPRDRTFIKDYGFLSFSKNMGKNIGKNINLSDKYSQKFLDHTKQSALDALETVSKRAIQKQQRQPVIGLVITLLMELQKSQTFHHRIA